MSNFQTFVISKEKFKNRLKKLWRQNSNLKNALIVGMKPGTRQFEATSHPPFPAPAEVKSDAFVYLLYISMSLYFFKIVYLLYTFIFSTWRTHKCFPILFQKFLVFKYLIILKKIFCIKFFDNPLNNLLYFLIFDNSLINFLYLYLW